MHYVGKCPYCDADWIRMTILDASPQLIDLSGRPSFMHKSLLDVYDTHMVTPKNMFSDKEVKYLKSQRLARISTVSPEDLQPDVSPVGFDFDGEYFYVSGFNLSKTRKYKNVLKNNKVALVIDDLETVDPWAPRGIRITEQQT